MYPNLIVDNFFDDPDSIVDLSRDLKYSPSEDGKWPGLRSDNLHRIDYGLFDFVCRKISHLFYPDCEGWTYHLSFQKVMPFSKNQYDKKNWGWIHKDKINFGGVIFLTKKPDDDTGVTIYRPKRGAYNMPPHIEEVKNMHFFGNDVDDDRYYESYDTYHNQFEETIKVKNIYNRLVLFNSNSLHADQTFGTKERLTMPFFNYFIQNTLPPLYR